MAASSIKDASIADAQAIADIYNHYIIGSTATFDTQSQTAGVRAADIAARDAAHPVIVAHREETIQGWASLSFYRARPAWRHTAEVAVYLRPDAVGQGLGSELLLELVRRASSTDLHVLIAQVVTENSASMALFDRMGFEQSGTLKQVGFKFDRWLDVAMFQKTL